MAIDGQNNATRYTQLSHCNVDCFVDVYADQSQSVDSTDASWDRDVTQLAGNSRGDRGKTADSDVTATAAVTRDVNTISTDNCRAENSRLSGINSYSVPVAVIMLPSQLPNGPH